MHGLGRWLVYSRPRAWVGQRFELPNLLKGVELPLYARCLDLATGLGWATAGIAQYGSLRHDPVPSITISKSCPAHGSTLTRSG